MTWFGLTEKDGGFKDEEGVWHDTVEDYVRTEVFGMCGCGTEDATWLAVDVLRACQRKDEYRWPQDAVKEILMRDPKTTAELVMHLLDSRDVIEHGSSVGGSWTTDFGDEVLAWADTVRR